MLKVKERLQKSLRAESDFIEDVAFILLVWSAPCTLLSHAYLRLKSKSTPADSVVQMENVEKRYLQTPVDEINEIMYGESKCRKKHIDEATRFRMEFDLALWIDQQNSQRGVAPTVSLVQRHMMRQAKSSQQLSEPVALSTPVTRSTTWIQRFRQRWNLERGRFSARETISVDDLRNKAR